MVDIHHHLLFGIDDGSKSLEQSVAMVQMAAEDGITHIVATPHANDTWRYDRARNEGLLAQIREALPPDTRDRMHLGLGCDFHMNFENTEDAHTNGRRYSINEGEYLLIELPDMGISARMEEMLYTMRVDGLTPILTHPERNLTLQRQPELLRGWVQSGLLVQVTAGSVTGNFGPRAEEMAWNLLRANSVHFLATDAHNLERRPPVLSVARKMVEEKLGSALAERLCISNPLAVYENKQLPAQPQAFQQPDDDDDETPSFWKRLLGRR